MESRSPRPLRSRTRVATGGRSPHADLGQGLVEVAVVVPALPVVDELQEPNPALDEAVEDLAVDAMTPLPEDLSIEFRD